MDQEERAAYVAVGEELERAEDLLGELAQERERHAVELGVLEQVVQVVAQHLEDDALVPTVDEVVQQAHQVVLVRPVLLLWFSGYFKHKRMT
jgi:2-phospho-L-lactate guanylyltransferase (CobY/MobA/RfbA family)